MLLEKSSRFLKRSWLGGGKEDSRVLILWGMTGAWVGESVWKSPQGLAKWGSRRQVPKSRLGLWDRHLSTRRFRGVLPPCMECTAATGHIIIPRNISAGAHNCYKVMPNWSASPWIWTVQLESWTSQLLVKQYYKASLYLLGSNTTLHLRPLKFFWTPMITIWQGFTIPLLKCPSGQYIIIYRKLRRCAQWCCMLSWTLVLYPQGAPCS